MVDQWRNIYDEQPRDGQHCLVCSTFGRTPETISGFDYDVRYWVAARFAWYNGGLPGHTGQWWMPLPEPPAGKNRPRPDVQP